MSKPPKKASLASDWLEHAEGLIDLLCIAQLYKCHSSNILAQFAQYPAKRPQWMVPPTIKWPVS